MTFLYVNKISVCLSGGISNYSVLEVYVLNNFPTKKIYQIFVVDAQRIKQFNLSKKR